MPEFNRSKDPQAHRELQAHGRPTHKARWPGVAGRMNEVWVYCPVCLAEKDGWRKDGSPRFTGGTIRVQYRLPSGRTRTFLAACSCDVGLAVQDRYEKIAQDPNALRPFRSYRPGQKIKIPVAGDAYQVVEVVRVIVPGEGKDVEIRAIGERRSA